MKRSGKSAVIGNRVGCQAEVDLASAQRVQQLLTEIASRFVTRHAEEMDDAIEDTQRLICETLGLDRSTLWLFAGDAAELALSHYWQRSGGVPLRRNFITLGNLPWAATMVRQGTPFHFSSLSDLPPEAARDVETLKIHGSKSNATFPLVADGKVFGALAFATITEERQWTGDELASLKLVALIFGHLISNRRAEDRANQLRDEIQRSSRASMLGEIAAALAHEINQPLTTILSNAQAARRFIQQGTAGPAEITAILDDIIRDDKRAADIVRNLRKMLSGNPVQREACCLNELVIETSSFLQSGMKCDGITCQLDLAQSLPRIKMAREEIQQILVNLLTNAAQSMNEIPAENKRIIISTRASDLHVELRVRDHGCGIAPDHLDRIFEPFHTTRADGLGIGLAVCRRIAEAHHGGIVAGNATSAGAEFLLSLPIVVENTDDRSTR